MSYEERKANYLEVLEVLKDTLEETESPFLSMIEEKPGKLYTLKELENIKNGEMDKPIEVTNTIIDLTKELVVIDLTEDNDETNESIARPSKKLKRDYIAETMDFMLSFLSTDPTISRD